MEWKCYNGKIVRSGMEFICKKQVEFQGMRFDPGCQFTINEDQVYHECYVQVHVSTPEYSGALLESLMLNFNTIGLYLESGDIEEVKQ